MEGEKLPATIFVVFGISGDLSRRYFLPALVEIQKAKLLPDEFKILGISRRDISTTEIITSKLKPISKYFELIMMNLDERTDYVSLNEKIRTIRKSFKSKPQIIFYLVVPPDAVHTILWHLGDSKMNGRNVKIMLEKPFGSDLSSARQMAKRTKKYFRENQLYHIDHYLAKEVAQNISVFLGSNALFRDVWNNQFIEKIEIVAAEKIGAEDRGFFYEQTGAMKDLVQSHLLQLAALVLTDPPTDVFDLERLPPGRLAALKSIRSPSKKELRTIITGQYENYGNLVGNPDSMVETFVDITLHSSDPRWRGVPIRLTTGKKLKEKRTEIKIYFKKLHHSQSNLLCIRIQPKESIELDLWVKEPGLNRRLKKLSHSFDYGYHFGRLPNAYEQVVVDVIRGSHGLFATTAEVIASWRILQSILDHWQSGQKNLRIYKPGATIEKIVQEN